MINKIRYSQNISVTNKENIFSILPSVSACVALLASDTTKETRGNVNKLSFDHHCKLIILTCFSQKGNESVMGTTISLMR